MNVNAIMQQVSKLSNVQSSGGMAYQGVQFEDIMQHKQIQADIAAHLKGVPLSTVLIPPEVLSRMEADPKAYSYYMNAIDEYVYAYKHYNRPGVISMSFFIDGQGRYCIRGVNEILKKQIEDSKKDDRKVKPMRCNILDVPETSEVYGAEIPDAVYGMIAALNSDKRKDYF